MSTALQYHRMFHAFADRASAIKHKKTLKKRYEGYYSQMLDLLTRFLFSAHYGWHTFQAKTSFCYLELTADLTDMESEHGIMAANAIGRYFAFLGNLADIGHSTGHLYSSRSWRHVALKCSSNTISFTIIQRSTHTPERAMSIARRFMTARHITPSFSDRIGELMGEIREREKKIHYLNKLIAGISPAKD